MKMTWKAVIYNTQAFRTKFLQEPLGDSPLNERVTLPSTPNRINDCNLKSTETTYNCTALTSYNMWHKSPLTALAGCN